MKIRYVLLILFLVSIQASIVQAQEKLTLNKVNERLKILEGHKDNLDEQFKIKMDENTGNFNLWTKKVDSKLSDVDKRCNSFFDKVSYLGVPGTVIAFIALIISIWVSIHKIAEKKINAKFDSILNDKKEKLIQLINTQDEELILKTDKSIMVISELGTDESFMEAFFDKMGFKKVQYKKADDIQSYNSCDLVLFDDEDGSFDHNKIKKIADKFPASAVCFYFGMKIELNNEERKRYVFANSRLQLYGNIMNALRYQSLL